MNFRIKELRKTLKLTQTAFAEKIGLTGAAITRIEKGERNPSEQTILSICREFRVNYFWLTEGKGEMFTSTPETVVEELVEQYDLDDIDKKIIEKYLELDAEQRKVLKEYLKSIFVQE
ncbi:transcriptional repressor DicA [Clostridiales bacterium CHKCI001]|nr:transcriptional repressor DicA [Clostridiales bacterium CHKCI001]